MNAGVSSHLTARTCVEIHVEPTRWRFELVWGDRRFVHATIEFDALAQAAPDESFAKKRSFVLR